MNIQQLTRLFWDVDTSASSFANKKTIIIRTLSHGTFGEIQSLFATYDSKAIQNVFNDMKPDALSKRRRAYFTLIFS